MRESIQLTFTSSYESLVLCGTIDIVGDEIVERNESFTVSLIVAHPNDRVSQANSTTVTIIDDDGMVLMHAWSVV